MISTSWSVRVLCAVATAASLEFVGAAVSESVRIAIKSTHGSVVIVTEQLPARYVLTGSIPTGSLATVELTLPDTLDVPVISDVAEIEVSYGDILDETAAPIIYLIVRPPSSSTRTSFFAMPATKVEKDERSRVTRMTTNLLSRRSISSIVGRVATVTKADVDHIRVFVGVLREPGHVPYMYLAEVK